MSTIYRSTVRFLAVFLVLFTLLGGPGLVMAQSPTGADSPSAMDYSATLTAVPSVTTLLAGQSTVVTFKANIPSGSCIGTAGYYITPSGGTLTASQVAVSFNMHNSAQFVQLNQAAYQLSGGSPLVIGTVVTIPGTAQLNGPALFELYQATLTINKAGVHTFTATDGPGIGQFTQVSCNGQTFGIASGFSVTVNNSTVSGKVTNSTSGSPGPAISGVTVELYSGATLVASTTTNGTGDYTLTTNGPGNFTVKVVTPSGSPNYVPATATEIAVSVPGNVTGKNFEFVTTTAAVATMTTIIPQYDLAVAGSSVRNVTWTHENTAGTQVVGTGSVALTAGGTFNKTLANVAGYIQIEVPGFNDDWSVFTPGTSALGTNLLCVDVGNPGNGQTGAEEGTLIASLQGTVAAPGTPSDNNVDGFVTQADYTTFLGSFGCVTNVVVPFARLVSAKSGMEDVVTFGMRTYLRSDGMSGMSITARTNGGVSGVVVVIEPAQWGLTSYKALKVPGFSLRSEIESGDKVAYYFEADVVDGVLPQVTLSDDVEFVVATIGVCNASSLQSSTRYPYSHAARPGERLNTAWEGIGRCSTEVGRWILNLPIMQR